VDEYFRDMKKGLSKTRSTMKPMLESVAKGKKGLESFLEELEEVLILSDVGFETSHFLIERFREVATHEHSFDSRKVMEIMVPIVTDLLSPVASPLKVSPPHPFVILVLGVNGSGKTTTIGKMAKFFADSGFSVMLGAGDTFRAAAIEQLEIWGKRVGADVVKHRPGADSSAVAYDTVKSACARKKDVVLIDTAGRLHTNRNLMGELEKIKRVIGRELPGAPGEVLLVIDATTGQNGIAQARSFAESLGVTGLAITKIDGTAKGGILLSITRELAIPVRFVGVGEGENDLKPFLAEEFVRAMFFHE